MISALVIFAPAQADAPPPQRSLAQIVAAAKPAVVYIVVETPDGAQSGTGFVLKSDAQTSTVVTANHVIEGGSTVDVIFDSDEHQRFTAQVVSHDHVKDVAILAVPIGNRPVLPLAEGTTIQEGESIAVIGYPLATHIFRRVEGDSLRPSVHEGIVSAIRFSGAIIQFDAATYHGDSGGPILDATTGAVVAIVHGVLLDPFYSSAGAEQTLPGSSFGPSSTTIASVLGGNPTTAAPPAQPAVAAEAANVPPAAPSTSMTAGAPADLAAAPVAAQSAITATSASYRVGYGVPHLVSSSGSADLANQINDELQSGALERLTTFLKADNSLYLVPVAIRSEVERNPQLLSGYCDDNRLNALVFPVYSWNLTGGPRYNGFGAQVGYTGNASVAMAFYVVDCYGEPFFVDRQEKSEGRRFAHRTPDREVVDMANDLLDHLMTNFSTARATHQGAWNSLLKTGLPIDPDDGRLHSLFFFSKKPEGFQVTVVVPDGPADKAGIKVQDVITSVNNTDINTMSKDDLAKTFGSSSYTLVVQRPGGPVTVTVHPQAYADLVRTLQH
jgi:S1-C subfamily serine protease